MSDTSILNVLGLARRNAPAGPSIADDTATFTTGTVYETDAARGRVRVRIGDGAVWLPAIADRYSSDSLARVLLDPYTARPVLVAGAVAPRRPVVLGGVISGPTSGVLTVSVDGIIYGVDTLPGAYTVGAAAWVQLDEWGAPFLAIGPSSKSVPGWTPPVAPPPSGTVTAFATIGAQWSGSWDSDSAKWGNWNAYMGVSNVWQGDNYGSGLQRGFFGYGDQVANLGAASIESVVLRVKMVRYSTALVVQGSPSGTQPPGSPSSSGDTAASPTIGTGQTGDIALTALMREALRTGATKGLVSVGAGYGCFGGTATPGSGVLHIQYTKNV